MAELSFNQIDSLLSELAEFLAYSKSDRTEWLICGGTALGLQGLNTRVTRDVDVLEIWQADEKTVVAIEKFPPAVQDALRRVAALHPELEGIKENWVNLGPRRLLERGLPSGFAGRLCTKTYVDALTLHLLGRLDLITLKLYAAADRHGHRQEIHIGDLRQIGATFDELDFGVDWIRMLPDFNVISYELRTVIERLGYDDLAQYV